MRALDLRHPRTHAQPGPARPHQHQTGRLTMTKNFIAGEWVAAAEASPNINPSNTHDVVGEYARATAADAERAIAAAKAAFPAWSRSSIAAAPRHPESRRRRDPRAQGGARAPARPRGGQDARRGHRRDRPRGPDLRVLRRRVPAAGRREAAVGAPGRRRRDHPRAGRRRRPDHALELPDRHPGLEDRAGARLRQHRGVQAGRPRAGLRLGARPRSSSAPACRRACSTWSWARARWSARRCSTARTSPRSPSPARSATGTPRGQTCVTAEPMKKFQLEMGGKNPLVVLDDADLKRRGRLRRQRRLLLDRPALHRLVAADRDRGHPRPVRRGDAGAHARPGGRRCAEGRHADRPGGRPEPARAGPGLHRASARTRAPSWSPAASG